MAIPDFQTLMLPILKLCADEQEHASREIGSRLADEFGLTQDEREQPLPSGGQALFTNRVAWALAHLKMAKVMENPRRGVYRITPRGLALLEESPASVNMKLLRRFPEYVAARKTDPEPREQIVAVNTPQELIEEAYRAMLAVLSDELLQKVKGCSPLFFQKLVTDLLIKMGYGGTRDEVQRAVKRGADEGIDGIINEDRLGLERVYIQAKRWGDTVVGRPELQRFAGALQGQQANKGVFITTSVFSREARDYAAKISTKIVLVDGEFLVQLMIEHGVGISSVETYDIRQIDSDYFTEEFEPRE